MIHYRSVIDKVKGLTGLAIAWQVKSSLDYCDSGHKHHISFTKQEKK